MKAWLVRNDPYATIIFAETRGKAKVLAQHTETCEDCDFCDIEIHRVPKADKYYKNGKTEMDWQNPKDRIILVKEFGFQCVDILIEECEECSAKEFCDVYAESKEYYDE